MFVRDPALKRGAVALDEDTVVLALGGKPGAPHELSAWEAMFAAVPAVTRGRLGRGDPDHEEALVEQPEHPALLYNLACMEARGGRQLDALLHLRGRSSSSRSGRSTRAKDCDFDSIRREPGFPAV